MIVVSGSLGMAPTQSTVCSPSMGITHRPHFPAGVIISYSEVRHVATASSERQTDKAVKENEISLYNWREERENSILLKICFPVLFPSASRSWLAAPSFSPSCVRKKQTGPSGDSGVVSPAPRGAQCSCPGYLIVLREAFCRGGPVQRVREALPTSLAAGFSHLLSAR